MTLLFDDICVTVYQSDFRSTDRLGSCTKAREDVPVVVALVLTIGRGDDLTHLGLVVDRVGTAIDRVYLGSAPEPVPTSSGSSFTELVAMRDNNVGTVYVAAEGTLYVVLMHEPNWGPEVLAYLLTRHWTVMKFTDVMLELLGLCDRY